MGRLRYIQTSVDKVGAMMTLGRGALVSGSTKQRLNCKSSTDTEIVAVDNYMPIILWCSYFIEWQGYILKTILYQDNQSAELLENNGMSSMGRQSRHINIRYFFITDRVKNGDLSIEHCGTEDMVADYFTKPLQGAKFRKFRKLIMNEKEEIN